MEPNITHLLHILVKICQVVEKYRKLAQIRVESVKILKSSR
jgi:hypothetical protein